MSKSKPEPHALPKRFYKAVAVQQSADGFGITLDGKLLRTQGRNALNIASQQLAAAIADEWDAQRDVVNPDMMPLTRLINLTIDRVPADRSELLAELARYGETDLVCYRAPVNDAALRQRQDKVFDPLLAWARDAYGINLAVTEGVMPVAQSAESLARLDAEFAAARDAQLAALAMLVPLLGSAVLVLALWKGKITVDEALFAARLDEDYQAEKWGAEPMAVAAWEAKCIDVRAASFFLTCNALN